MIFANYPGHFIAAFLLVVCASLVALAFHSREMQKDKIRSYRFLLMGLRYTSILILLVILWNPSRSKLVNEVTRNSVLVLFDTSRSMSVIEEQGTTRLDKAVKIFNDVFRPENKKGPEYTILGFDKNVYHSGSTGLLKRWGTETDMQSVFAAIGKYDITEQDNSYSAKPENADKTAGTANDRDIGISKIKGAVLFTDGRVDDQSLAPYIPLVRGDFPIVIVGIGSRKTTTDIWIKSLRSPARASIDSAYNVEVIVSADNPGKEPVVIELLEDDEVIDKKQIDPEMFSRKRMKEKRDVTVEFTVVADSLGSHSLLARAKALKNEVNQANNIRAAMVEVVDADKLRVLFYTQAANFNVGKLREVLARDHRIQLDFGLDAIKTVGLSAEASKKLGYVRLPENREGFNRYDIIILEHCLLDNLTNEQIDGLYSFVVQRGGGLILLPGRGDFGPGNWKSPGIQALFPVIFEKDDPKLWPPNPGKIELINEALNGNIISPDDIERYDIEVSAFYKIEKVKPAASTFAKSGDIPLVILHRVGRGRVCLLNISRLFLWYREDEQGGLLYKLVSGLISTIGATPGPASGIELFAERINDGDKVKFSARVCDSSFTPVEQANVLLDIKAQVLTMEPTGKGYYIAEIDNVDIDTVIATAQAEVGGVFLGERTIAVNLPPHQTEMFDTQINEQFMQTLAERINGKYVYADDINRDITKMFEAQTHIGTSRSMTSVWPSWPLFLILCIILSMEWFLRRKKGLV